MEPSTSKLKDESPDFKSKVSQWISKHFIRDHDQEDQQNITKSVERQADQSISESDKDTSDGEDATEQFPGPVEGNAQPTSERGSVASAAQTPHRPGDRNIGNFFNVLKSRTVAELGEHEPCCRLHWTRQSFYHKTGRDDFSPSSGRDKAFKCTCSRANRYKRVVCKDDPSPSEKTCGERATDDCQETESGNTESEGAVHVGKKTGHVKKGKWWKCKRLKKHSMPKVAVTAKQDTYFGKGDIEDSRQILLESETDFEVLNKLRNSVENILENSTEVKTGSAAQTQSSLITSKPKVFKSKIPRPVNYTRVRDSNKSPKTRKPQIVDDLFISKITINDELKYLRRDLALGWLTRNEARDRLQDVKRRFKVDLGSFLTSREFQQVFGGSDDESEWDPIGPWTWEHCTDV